MVYKVVYTKSSQKDLTRLDLPVVQRILKKVDEYSKQDDPFEFAKKLTGFSVDTYRFRVGDYRVVFRPDPQNGQLVILVVIRVKHRKEVYKNI